eukprot:Phypoly_transcript_11194.p1 GENE.Phypoly_transcript_11194~~Phypoly_transcript_11194.p1  ORF type:complete len:140 (+),score=18.47 Phypoly_transcript_11194:416-835(+)
MKVVCVAIVGRANNPLYIRSFDQNEDPLKYHYIVHSSLDVVEERVHKDNNKKVQTTDMYLGLLYPTEDYKVYGYTTNTKIKLIVVVLDDADVKDSDIKNFFRWFHNVYTGTVCNPFYVVDTAIKSKKFDKDLDQAIRSM